MPTVPALSNGSRRGIRLVDPRVFATRRARLEGLPERCRATVLEERLEPADRCLAFVSVLGRDAGDSFATLELVLARSSVSSQMVNLSASVHLRALLTDFFLLGDALRSRLDEAARFARAWKIPVAVRGIAIMNRPEAFSDPARG